MKRFEVARRPAQEDAEGWRVSIRQLALLVPIGFLIVGAIYVLERGTGADLGFVGVDQTTSLGEDGAGPGPVIGELAPDFTLDDVTGTPVQLSSFRGHPVLLNFWATWCPPCRAEMPEIDAVAREQAGTGLVVLAVNLQEEPETVATYLGTLGVSVPALLDRSGGVFRQYRIAGLPTTVAVDRAGVIQRIHVGPLNKRGIMDLIATIA